jgi:hypothetical protein
LERGEGVAMTPPVHGALHLRRWTVASAVLILLAGGAVTEPASAQTSAVATPSGVIGGGASIAGLVAEAAQRFGVPEAWIAAVMRAESAFNPRATSPKGAMGLMQLMPDTWAAMRARLGLGVDPYDPHDNILAGAQYLRDLYDQFGAGGFLAAYNAGPGRYLDFLTRGRPLPTETRRYVSAIAPIIDGRAAPPIRAGSPSAIPQTPRPSLFAPIGASHATAEAAPISTIGRTAADPLAPSSVANTGLFAGAWGRSPQ